MFSELASPLTSSCSYSFPILPVNVCDFLQKFLSASFLNSVDVLIVEIHSSSHLHTFNLKLFKRTEAPMCCICFSKNQIKLPMKMKKKYNHVLTVEIHSSSHLHAFNVKLFKRTEAPMYCICFSKNQIKLAMKMKKKIQPLRTGSEIVLVIQLLSHSVMSDSL